MNYRNLVAALMLMSAGSLAAAQALPASVKAAGKIVLANKPNYPPMEYKDPDTGTLLGFDIELGDAVGKLLGVPMEWASISFEQMPPSLATGRADLIMSAMIDTPERHEVFDMINYLKSGAQIYTLSANAAEFKAPADLCGKKVGMSRTTKYPTLVGEWSKQNCAAKGKPDIIIMGSDGSADARSQLKQGRIVAAVQGPETFPYLFKQEPNTYSLVGAPLGELLLGIGVAKKNTELRDSVVAALKTLMDNGTYKALLAKYKLEGLGLQAVSVNGKPVK